MTLLPLKDISTLRTGTTINPRRGAGPTRTVKVVQMRDLGDTSVNTGCLATCDLKLPRRVEFLKPGDIIFRSRGVTTTAVTVPRGIGKAILAAPLFFIRVKEERETVPGYIGWYINQPPAQKFIAGRTEGSALKMVSLRHIGELNIPLPSRELQEKIILTDSLLKKEAAIMEEITRKRKQYVESVLIQAALEA